MTIQSRKKYKDTIETILADKPVGYHPDLAKVFGGVKNAVMLSQLLWWKHNPTAISRGGWFWKTEAEFYDETGLSPCEQETARNLLQDAGVIQFKRRGCPPRIWYRVRKGLGAKMEKFYSDGWTYSPKKKSVKRVKKTGRWASKNAQEGEKCDSNSPAAG